MTRFIGRLLTSALAAALTLAPTPVGAAAICTVDADCDDGLFCNGTEFCFMGSCVALSACPPFIDGCVTVLGCDEASDTCIIGPDDSLCDDGLFCNGIESCDGDSKSCVAISSCPPFIDGCVTSQGCDEASDTCIIGPDDSLCDDGLFCNGIESCDGESKSCVAISSCPPFVNGCVTNQGCDEGADTCLMGPDDSLCNPGEVCLPTGECVTTTTSTSSSTSTSSTTSTTSSTSTSTSTSTSSTTATSSTSTSSSTTSTSVTTSSSTTTSTSTSSSSSTTTSTTGTSTTTTSTLPATAIFPPGTKLLVKQKKSGVQQLKLIARSADIDSTLPCEVEGELVVEALGAVTRFPLEATGWKPVRAKKPEKGCKYRKGPVVSTVQVKTGKLLKVVANADDLGIPLAGDPRPVLLEVRHGDVRHCFEFGGNGTHKDGKKLIAKNAEPASGCPPSAPSGGLSMPPIGPRPGGQHANEASRPASREIR